MNWYWRLDRTNSNKYGKMVGNRFSHKKGAFPIETRNSSYVRGIFEATMQNRSYEQIVWRWLKSLHLKRHISFIFHPIQDSLHSKCIYFEWASIVACKFLALSYEIFPHEHFENWKIGFSRVEFEGHGWGQWPPWIWFIFEFPSLGTDIYIKPIWSKHWSTLLKKFVRWWHTIFKPCSSVHSSTSTTHRHACGCSRKVTYGECSLSAWNIPLAELHSCDGLVRTNGFSSMPQKRATFIIHDPSPKLKS